MAFALQVALSFIVGGVYVSGIVRAAESLGTKVGGAIADMPSTLLVSLAFISISDGASAAKIASSVVPVFIPAVLFYCLVFVKVAERIEAAHKHLWASFIAALSWTLISLILRALFSDAAFELIVASGILGIGIFYLLFKSFPITKPRMQPVIKSVYIVRFLVAGSVVSSAVLLARLLGPTWGGLAASFPATVASSLYFLNKSQSCKFTKGFVRKLPAGFISTYLFIIILHLTLIKIGAMYSFLLAMAGAFTYTATLIISKLRSDKTKLKTELR